MCGSGGIDRDGALTSEPEAVAFQRIELDFLDVQRRESPILVPRWNRCLGQRLAVRLRKHEPVRLIDEPRCRRGFLAAVVGGALDGDRAAERDRLLAPPYVAVFFFPAYERGDRSGLNAPRQALRPR